MVGTMQGPCNKMSGGKNSTTNKVGHWPHIHRLDPPWPTEPAMVIQCYIYTLLSGSIRQFSIWDAFQLFSTHKDLLEFCSHLVTKGSDVWSDCIWRAKCARPPPNEWPLTWSIDQRSSFHAFSGTGLCCFLFAAFWRHCGAWTFSHLHGVSCILELDLVTWLEPVAFWNSVSVVFEFVASSSSCYYHCCCFRLLFHFLILCCCCCWCSCLRC